MKDTNPIPLLVVEDSEISQVLIESLFDEHPNFSTTIVPNGKMAFAAIKKERPKLILLDIMLPDMDGYQILKRLKQDTHTKDIPVIMVSAKGRPEDIQKALEMGAEEYIMKPIGVNKLIDRVVNLVEKLNHSSRG
ncbi:MAG: response regulator [Bacteroidota bacterium]